MNTNMLNKQRETSRNIKEISLKINMQTESKTGGEDWRKSHAISFCGTSQHLLKVENVLTCFTCV
jgi:hypothetical protein